MKLECGCIIQEWDDGMRRRDYCKLHSQIKYWQNELLSILKSHSENIDNKVDEIQIMNILKEMEKETY